MSLFAIKLERKKNVNSPNTLKRTSDREQHIDEWYEAIDQVLQDAARKGLIVDTGRRRWSERTGRYEIVWTARKNLN